MLVKPFPATILPARKELADELLAVEAPLHIKVNGIPYTTTVRTPGDDADFARGLLFTEGVIPDPAASLAIRAIPDPETGYSACLEVTVPTTHLAKDLEARRSAIGSASCGFCGLREPEELQLSGPPLHMRRGSVSAAHLQMMLEAMHAAQPAFQQTGGCHAAAAFTAEGALLACYEDIGRHNAVDKVAGRLLNIEMLESAAAILVSGRVSYEIVFKAYRAGIPVVAGISAASSLAVEMGQQFGLCVIGFCRGGRATVYSHQDRILHD